MKNKSCRPFRAGFWSTVCLLVGAVMFVSCGGASAQVVDVHDFTPGTVAFDPDSPVISASDGNYYGTTLDGGANGCGAVYRVSPAGAYTLVHSFTGIDGAQPWGLTAGAGGWMYGVTAEGGANNYGTIYKINAKGTVVKLADFPSTYGPYPGALGISVGPVAIGSGGQLYGVAVDNYGDGVIYEYANGTINELYVLPYDEVETPLIVDASGNIYGEIEGYDGPAAGEIFELAADGTYNDLFDLPSDWSMGAHPVDIALDSSGNLWGVTIDGGDYSSGVLFEIPAGGAYQVVHSFDGADGYIGDGVCVGPDGTVYGTTGQGGANNDGALFSYSTGGTYNLLHSFAGPDGIEPLTAGLSMGADGALYGATYSGSASTGSVYRVATNGSNLQVLHSFALADGLIPVDWLVVGPDGKLYGTTVYGGACNQGCVFRLNANGTTTLVHSFSFNDGNEPLAGLLSPGDGNLYGTTGNYGYLGYKNYSSPLGSVYKLTTTGVETVLHVFQGSDLLFPISGLVADSNMNLYGMAAYAGANGVGGFFETSPNGATKTLASFPQNTGVEIDSTVALAPDGTLYGISDPSLFSVSPGGTLNDLYNFCSFAPPNGTLFSAGGLLYGTTQVGGDFGLGSIFSYDPSTGNITTLYSFDGSAGYYPTSIILASDGNFYGTANGSIFEMSGGVAQTVPDFSSEEGSMNPYGPLVEGDDGALYGLAASNGYGQVFKVILSGTSPNALPTITGLSPTSTGVGSGNTTITITGTGFASDCTVAFGENLLTPTTVTPTSLTVVVPSADLTALGTFPVRVSNPVPGGGVTSAVNFNVVPVTIASVTVSPTSTKGGTAVQLVIRFNAPVPAGGIPITVATNAPAIADPSGPNVTAPQGPTTLRVSVLTKTVTVGSTATLSATNTLDGTTKSCVLTVTP